MWPLRLTLCLHSRSQQPWELVSIAPFYRNRQGEIKEPAQSLRKGQSLATNLNGHPPSSFSVAGYIHREALGLGYGRRGYLGLFPKPSGKPRPCGITGSPGNRDNRAYASLSTADKTEVPRDGHTACPQPGRPRSQCARLPLLPLPLQHLSPQGPQV